METPEVHSPHVSRRRKRRREEGLPQWLELAVAVTALITSISSIVLAVGNGNSMDRLVRANSIPYLQGGFSDITPEGADVLTLDLLNRGVGPAHEKSLRVTVSGRYVRSVNELISASLGAEAASSDGRAIEHIAKNRVPTRFIPGGQIQTVFRLAKTPENALFWDRLAAAQSRWNVDYCYCSVFDECWRVPSKWIEPQPVKECRRDDAHEFVP